MTPVEYIESTYDSWVRFHTDDGHLKYQARGSVITQPMFQFKEDAAGRDDPDCSACGHGKSHECDGCGVEITHMAQGLCIPCWQKREIW